MTADVAAQDEGGAGTCSGPWSWVWALLASHHLHLRHLLLLLLTAKGIHPNQVTTSGMHSRTDVSTLGPNS